MLNKGLFSSDKDDWETPQQLFNKLNEKYHFVIDLAASVENAKLPRYFTTADDALSQDWSQINGSMFLNPPYGRHINAWVRKAYETSLLTTSAIVLLIPARTDTSYWHDYIFGKAHVSFLRGRLKFERGGASRRLSAFSECACRIQLEEGWLK